jgi:hypothetical protein
MDWTDRLERRLGRIAVPGITRIVVAFNALVYVLTHINPAFISIIELDRDAVLQGEVWRLVTFLFIPRYGNLFPDWLAIILYLWFVWMIGEQLEAVWGAFKLTLYYLLGMIGAAVAAIVFGGSFSNMMLNTSLFFAFARFFPDMVIYVMWVLPMKVKWLAWITAALLVMQFLTSTMSFRAAMLAALGNYLLFFGPEIYRDTRARGEVATRRRRFERQAIPTGEPLHRCAVCERTDLSNPELTFRVGRDGQDYCEEHLPGTAATQA